MEFKVVMTVSILAFCTFSGILGRNLQDHANDQFASANALPGDSASARLITVPMMRFYQWTRKNQHTWFTKNPKAPFDGTDSSCNEYVTVTNLGRPSRPPPPPVRPPHGPPPKSVAFIELPKSPRKSNLKSA